MKKLNQSINSKINFFDLHCDTPYECFIKNQEFKTNTLSVSANKGVCFKKWYQTFAVWVKDDIENPYIFYKNVINDFKEKLNGKAENLVPLFSVEGGAAIENEDILYEMKKDGVKIITLSWNGENQIAGGCKTDKGLTEYGKKVIKTMNTLKIVCDLSHLNRKSFLSALEKAEYPIASHSNCKSVFEHPRNLSDEQIILLKEKGGIIGLCPYPEFLGGDIVDKMYENICYLCDMGCEDNIAFGSDFDGAEQDEILADISKIPSFIERLEQKGIEKELLKKIFFKNAYKFIAKLR